MSSTGVRTVFGVSLGVIEYAEAADATNTDRLLTVTLPEKGSRLMANHATSPDATQSPRNKKRSSVSKGVRFDVFRRDQFTCQYCGAQPPDVALVVDHITPVAAGGDNDATNLITACVPCNAGKSAKLLTDRVTRPDADLMMLEVQQEIAEVQRYQAALDEREAAISRYLESVQHLWVAESGTDWHPSELILRRILKKYDPEILEAAVSNVAVKVGGGYLSERGDGWVRYLWSVAKNMTNGFEGE